MTHTDFCRLAKPLRALKMDYHYRETRKLLDPKWNPYSMPKDHDVIADDVPLHEANLVTSRVRDSDLHRVVLDLDYGAALVPSPMGQHLVLATQSRFVFHEVDRQLLDTLILCRIPKMEPVIRRVHQNDSGFDKGFLDILTDHDLALVPSTTEGHQHLILGVDLPWEKYIKLLAILATCGIIEQGYANASIAKGYTGIRPPWVKK